MNFTNPTHQSLALIHSSSQCQALREHESSMTEEGGPPASLCWGLPGECASQQQSHPIRSSSPWGFPCPVSLVLEVTTLVLT